LSKNMPSPVVAAPAAPACPRQTITRDDYG
jgi:hypothetical protein